jgi:hypothetical protein
MLTPALADYPPAASVHFLHDRVKNTQSVEEERLSSLLYETVAFQLPDVE